MSPSDPPQHLVVGRVLGPWGLEGALLVEVLTERPERFRPGAEVLVQGKPYRCRRVRWQRGSLLLWLWGVESREAAEALRGRLLEVPFTPPPPERFYHFQVIGLEVWTETGEFLGTVHRILETGSNDIYVVRGPRGEVLIPAIDTVVREIDPNRGRMVVHLLPGLLP